MRISRRSILGGLAATLLSFRTGGLDQLSSRTEDFVDCALLDLNSHCVLRESLRGYRAALADDHHLVEYLPESTSRYRFVIVPGIGSMDRALAQTLSNLLHAGTHLLLESGAGFLGPADFAVHQRFLLRYFGVSVLAPLDLWSGKFVDHPLLPVGYGYSGKKLTSRESIPYVNYNWPDEISVRDFSRAIPVSPKDGDVIGSVGAVPVALKKRMASGTLIFLGSPLGPALRSGDPDARAWLRKVAAL